MTPCDITLGNTFLERAIVLGALLLLGTGCGVSIEVLESGAAEARTGGTHSLAGPGGANAGGAISLANTGGAHSGGVSSGGSDTGEMGGNVAGTGGVFGSGGTTAEAGGGSGQGGERPLGVGGTGGLPSTGSGTGGLPSTGSGAVTGGSGAGGSSDLGGTRSQNAGQDAGPGGSLAGDAAASGGRPLMCNPARVLDGLPMTRTGFAPLEAVTGDVNGDGKLDLIMTTTLDGMSVVLGQGDGTFAANASYQASVDTHSVALGDLNGDGHLDLVTATDTATVLLGNGDGTFTAGAEYPTDSVSFTFGDVLVDFHVVLVYPHHGSYTVSVLLGNGDGTFTAGGNQVVGSGPWKVLLGDANGDTAPDLIVVASNVASVLLGKGDGTFGTKVDFPTGGATDSESPTAKLADLNGDGRQDLVVAGLKVTALFGEGDGVFGASVDLNSEYGTYSLIALTDLNGDHQLDLVLNVSGTVSVRFGNGDGSFAPGVSYTTGAGEDVRTGVLADFDGDGLLDLAVAFMNNSAGWVRMLLGTGAGAFRTTPTYPTGGEVTASALGDLDGDGHLDLATAGGVLPGKGDGTFAAKRDFVPSLGAGAMTLGDLNGDGKLDIAVAREGASTVSVLLNIGAWTFSALGDSETGERPVTLALGDLNGDGKLDGVTGSVATSSTAPYLSSISILLGEGDGSFAPPVDYQTGIFSGAVALGDFNTDGKLDTVVANYGGTSGPSSVSVLLGNGDGTLAAAVNYGSPSALPISLEVGDLNSDGRLDIVWGNANNTVEVLLGKGDGTFTASGSFRGCAALLALGDANLDGKPDLVGAGDWGAVCLLLGNGDGTFASAIHYPASATSLALADLNADGRLELVATRNDEAFVLNLCR